MANENTIFGGLNFIFLVILNEVTTQCARNIER
jgi:hypothetical protein